MILIEEHNSQCPWQAGPSYIASKMDPARRAEEGNCNTSSTSGTTNIQHANGNVIDKSIIELLQKYPCKEENEGGGDDGTGGGGAGTGTNSPTNGLINKNQQHIPHKKTHGGKGYDSRRGGNGLCVFYWFLVTCIAGLIAFSMWLSWQISLRNDMINARRVSQKEPFSFDDIFNISLQPRSFSVDWVPGEDAYTYINSYGDLMLFNITSNITYEIINADILDFYAAHWVSADLNYVLLASDIKSLWRHSFYARYAIYDIYNDEIIGFPNSDELEGVDLQYAGWSPTENALAFVVGNNLYYQASPISEAVQVTTTGVDKIIFNAIPDWLYEEEILASHSAIWWSPDSRYISYAVFNCTNVPMFKFPYYGPKSDVYGDIIEIAYPKSGDTTPGRNTIAQLMVLDTENPEAPPVDIPPPTDLQSRDHYFLQVSWKDASNIAVAWANRVQNVTTHTICSIRNPMPVQCVENRRREVSGGWVDILPTLRFVEGGESYLSLQPQTIGAMGSWTHLAKITAPLDSEGDVEFLTSDNIELKSIAGVDSSTGSVYVISTDDNPGHRHLYRTTLEGSGYQCLSCNIPNCTYFSASFSDTGKYYILGCRGPRIPIYWLRHTESTYELVLENNADIAANLATKDLPRVEMLNDVPIGGGYMGYAKVLVPSSADNNPDNKNNLMVETYGGPGSQAVDTRFSVGFETFLASTHNVVYAFLDGRGTTSRGNDFKHLLYKRMATLEMEDQLLGGQWFKNNLPYVDPDRNAAIWGWSYGGFLTSHVVANESNVFECGISGAALIDRRYYDTAHSERYMGLATPEDNEAGYERTDITNKIEHFVGKNFLIVHGTADDNVHFASSAQFVKALTEEEIQFRFQLYTDLNHYFLGRSRHLYQLFTDFLLKDCWKNSEERAKKRRENRVMEANIKLHGVPDNRKIKNT